MNIKTSYFSFGQSHVHSLDNITLDRNIILKITAPNPRDEMFKLFGDKWAFEYNNEPNMNHFPRGIYELKF